MKKKLYLVQIAISLSSPCFLPYAMGCIAAYLRQDREITDLYEIPDIVTMREPVEKVLSRIVDPDLVAVSNVLWNTEYNKILVRELKKRYPDVTILFGGHGIPHNCDYLADHPDVDYVTYYEGEKTMARLLKALAHGEALDEDFLMSVATLGALAIGFLPDAASQFPEAVFVMLFFQVGELFEGVAEGRSRKSISHLLALKPDTVHVERGTDTLDVAPEEVLPGEVVLVRPGERIALDGTVLEGVSTLDTAALTGESVPRQTGPGEGILSGCVNLTGVLRIRAEKPYSASTAARILEMVEEAAENKSHSERFITRFAKVYTPVVVALALLLAVIPPLLGGGAWSTWIYRALMFLVVSCPCALVISVPLAFFGGIGGASRAGILVKGASHMDTLAALRTVVFDKTGTLTEGVFEVQAVHPEMLDEKELLHLAAHVERHSTHPVAAALREAYPEEKDDCAVSGFQEIAGKGLTATVNGKRVAVGNEKLMEAEGAQWKPCERKGTIIHVAMDGTYAGHIVISDRIKEDAAQAVDALHGNGIRQVVILSGDREETVAETAAATGADAFRAGLLPGETGLRGRRHQRCTGARPRRPRYRNGRARIRSSHRSGRRRADGRPALQSGARDPDRPADPADRPRKCRPGDRHQSPRPDTGRTGCSRPLDGGLRRRRRHRHRGAERDADA